MLIMPLWLVLLAFVNLSQQSIISTPSLIQQPVFANHIALLGDFNSLSIYSYINKTEDTIITNPSVYYQQNSTVHRLYNYNNAITNLYSIGNDSVLIYGNFTSFDDASHTSPILLNTTSSTITDIDPNSDIKGTVSSVFMDNNLIYIGGNFTYNNTNSLVIYDIDTQSLSDVAFNGFNSNSSINSILKINDSIIFGGNFYDLGNSSLLGSTVSNSTISSSSSNSTNVTSDQVISLKNAQFSAINGSPSTDQSSIICPGTSEWSLINGEAGEWTVSLSYSTQITKFRLYNSEEDGVSMFRLYTFPSDSIMNLSYIDPETQKISYCDAWCSLYNSSYLSDVISRQNLDDDIYTMSNLSYSSKYQEFQLLNQVDTDKITLTILHNYGDKASLSGIEFYQDSISVFANNSLNAPNCGEENEESVLMSGSSWYQSDSSYISTSATSTSDVGMTFYPDILYNGTYSILLYTPGCIQDNTCSSRGIVNATLYDGIVEKSTYLIYQNNDYDKFDYIYYGNLTTNVSLVMTLNSGLGSSDIIMVADKLQINIISLDSNNSSNSTSQNDTKLQLNGIFEYSLSNFSTLSNSSVGNSSINSLGYYLSSNATVDSLLYSDGLFVLSGNFNSSYGDVLSLNTLTNSLSKSNITSQNILSINSTAYLDVGNNYSSILGTDLELVESIPVGNVSKFASIFVGNTEYYILNGDSSDVEVWDNTNKSITDPAETLNISNSVYVPSLNATLLVGEISIMDSYNTDFYSSNFNLTGVVGQLTHSNYINDSMQIVGGNFEVDVNGTMERNLVFISGGKVNALPGIEFGSDAFVTNLFSNDNLLFIGVNGTVNVTVGSSNLSTKGLVIYDLTTQQFNAIQPSQLFGSNGISVNKIAVYESSDLALVAGEFDQAGSLSCPTLCIYDLDNTRWNNPPSDDLGGVVNDMSFINENEILIAGNLTLNGNSSYIATYNFKSQSLNLEPSLSSGLPGLIIKFILVDSDMTGRVLAYGDDFIYGYNNSDWVDLDFGKDIDFSSSNITDLKLLSLNSSDSENNEEFFPDNKILLLTGLISHNVYGDLNAVFHNGTSFIPYVYTQSASSSGIINNVLIKDIYTKLSSNDLLTKFMSRGKVVGIALACALGSVSFLSFAYMIPYFIFYRKLNKDVGQNSRIVESEMIDTVNPEHLIHEMDLQKGHT